MLRFSAIFRQTAVKQAILVFSITSLIVLVLGWLATISLSPPYIQLVTNYEKPSYSQWQEILWGCWERWDALWYMSIAKSGYAHIDGQAQQPTAFFPMYPALVAFFQKISPFPQLLTGIIVSRLSFLIGLIFLYLWTKEESKSDTIARNTLWLVATYPGAVFFHAPYSESIYFAAMMSSIYFARKQNWAYAGTLAGIAALCRVTGVLLFFPLAILAYESLKRATPQIQKFSIKFLFLLFPFISLAAWMVYLHFKAGNALEFVQQHQNWARTFHYPWITIMNGIRVFIENATSLRGPSFFLDTFAALSSIALACYMTFKKKVPFYAICILWIHLLPPLFSSSDAKPFWTFLRLTSYQWVLFFFIATSFRKVDKTQTQDKLPIILLVNASLFAFSIVLFVKGFWLM